MKGKFLIAALIVFILAGFKMLSESAKTDSQEPVADLLFRMGEPKPDHYLETSGNDLIWRGEQLIKEGKSVSPRGEKGKFISKYYTCTSCHNVVREDPNLAKVDQDARLSFAKEQRIPYLQASTFWGMVNRETWYNDDYVLKYGSLVEPARNSLKGAINLCATVCSQGRSLEDWEMESILAYLWSLGMKVSDLNLSESELYLIDDRKIDNRVKIELIKSKYLLKSPATFSEPPADKQSGYGLKGNPKLGKAIFELGCQHCHRPNGESDVIFEQNELTYAWLLKHQADNGDKSFYQIIRKGTYSAYGHQEYMPHYTQEKMSDQQLEHLRAFLLHPNDAL